MQVVYKTLEKVCAPEWSETFTVILATAFGTLRIVTFCVIYSRTLHRVFHNIPRDYKNLLQENRRTRIYETFTDRRNNSNSPPPPSKLFLIVVHISKSFCVLEYHTNKSVVTVQRAFCAKCARDTPTDKSISAWYKQFTETGCL